MTQCDQELCPMWDGETCPCATFGFDRTDLPAGGIFTIEAARLCECQHEPHPGEACPEQVRMGGKLYPCGCDS